MSPKIDLFAVAPTLMKDWQKAMIVFYDASAFDPGLAHLVMLRASQINGCANCINLHVPEALEHGETAERLYLLPAWQEAPCYSDRERAALAWTEVLTRLSEGRDRAAAYEALQAHFTAEEQVKLTLSINIINGWNRIAVGFGLFADPAAIKAARAAA